MYPRGMPNMVQRTPIMVQLARILPVLLLAAHAWAGERWYVLEMQGQRAGWTVEREIVEDDRVTTTSESRLTIRRGETEVSLEMASRFIETEKGAPIEMSSRTALGGEPTEDRWVFGEDRVRWTSTASGITTAKDLPLPDGSWLPPAAAGRYTEARLAAEADEITVRTIDPLNGLDPVVSTRSEFEHTTVEVLGRSVSAIKCSSRSTLYPDTTGTEFIDEAGNLLRSEVRLGAITITIIAADEQLAKADLDPPELMRSLFISPDRPIRKPYSRSRGVYVLSATEGSLPDIPSTGSQRVERINDESARIIRERRGTEPVGMGPEERAVYLAHSAMLSCEDPRIVELNKGLLAGSPDDPAQRAETLRRFVHRHIRSKDLSVGFASASETVRSREGDCTEHAVLLAAMLRADGIPSRVVSGLIYADRFAGGRDIFGYHMWTQALLPAGDGGAGEAWVDLDATLPDALPMTATHIALGVHALEGDSRTNALVDLAPLMGRLAITVESAE